MAPSSRRAANRVLLLCSSIHDRTAWPIWKFLEMRQRRDRMMDIAILAFNTNGGSFEARVDGDQYSFKPYKHVHNYQQDLLEHFVHRWHDPERTYFVYGGHGMGDYMDLEQGVTSLPVHQLASILGNRKFEGMIFDSCFMSNLDCAYHLRHHTRYIGACEGYMWEPDHIPSRHIFNHRTAALMCRGGGVGCHADWKEPHASEDLKDHRPSSPGPLCVLEQMQRRYCRHSPFADFSILDTTYVEDLRNFVTRYVIPRVYDRLTFYSDAQLKRLSELGTNTLKLCESLYHWNSSSSNSGESGGRRERMPPPSTTAPDSSVSLPFRSILTSEKGSTANGHDNHSNCYYHKSSGTASISRFPAPHHHPSLDIRSTIDRAFLIQNVQLEHSLYPSSMDDKHLIDLKSYLFDMAKEEAMEVHGGYRNTRQYSASSIAPGGRSNMGKDSWSVLGGLERMSLLPPRTHNVHLHGTTPSSSSSAWAPLPTTSVLSPSPILEGSGRQGLQLFDRVVMKQQGPRAKPLYAARLGGLSLSIHEFSLHSKPLEPWMLPEHKRTALEVKANRFLKEGKLEEVILPPITESGQVHGKVRSISPRRRKEKMKSSFAFSLCSSSTENSNRDCTKKRTEESKKVKASQLGSEKKEKPPLLLKLQQAPGSAIGNEPISSEMDLPSSTTSSHHSFFSSPTPMKMVKAMNASSSVSTPLKPDTWMLSIA